MKKLNFKKRLFSAIFLIFLWIIWICPLLIFKLNEQLNKNKIFEIFVIIFITITISIILISIYEIFKAFLPNYNNLLRKKNIFYLFIFLSFFFLIEKNSIIYYFLYQEKLFLTNFVILFIILLIEFLLYLFIKDFFLKLKNGKKKIKYFFLSLNILLLGYKAFVNLFLTKNQLIDFFILFIIAFSSDIFSYLGGNFFGKKKIFTKISPKKTIEGSIFGIIFSIFFSFSFLFYLKKNLLLKNFKKNSLFNYFLKEDLNFKLIFLTLIFIFLLTFISQLSDLFFSYIKRLNNIKDFENYFPGHGGLLDRFDSLFFLFISFYIINNFFEFILLIN
jgi:phosphatidate cytidylyltransferase